MLVAPLARVMYRLMLITPLHYSFPTLSIFLPSLQDPLPLEIITLLSHPQPNLP